MTAKFKKMALEELQAAVDILIYDILRNVDERTECIDNDTLCDLLEGFAGTDYVVGLKVRNEIVLSDNDKKYLLTILDKNGNV